MYTLRSFLWALRCCYTLRHGKLERVHLQREDLQRLTCHHSRVCRGSAEGLQRVCRPPLQRAAEPPPARCRGYPLHAAEPPLRAAEGTLCRLQSPPCGAQRVPSTRLVFWTDLRSTPCPRSDSPARYILANIERICGLHTRPSYSHRADHPHRAGGRALERSDIAKRRLRMVHGAIGLWRARVPPHSVLIWRTLPSAEAANHLPSAVSSLPPHTHRTCTLLSCASFASPRGRNERRGRAERLRAPPARAGSTLRAARHPGMSRACRCFSAAAPVSSV